MSQFALSGSYSLSKLSTMIAPIDAGIVITTSRLNAMAGSVKRGNLSNENKISATINAAIKYAIIIRLMKTGILYLMFP
jgi:hypothetical protein